MSLSPPGEVDDLQGEAVEGWSDKVSGWLTDAIAAGDFDAGPTPFYNPLDEPLDATTETVIWPALSGKLRALSHLTEEARWQLAEGQRFRRQDEYCEWTVTRDDQRRITRVTFSSEVFEWWEHIAQTDEKLLLDGYEGLVGVRPPLDDLFVGNSYNPRNPWNDGTRGPLVHLGQPNNNLQAAVSLAAAATVVRERNGKVVTDTQVLMACANLGDKDRFSDPSIATAVNAKAALGARISLANPPGLYLLGIRTEGMRLPEGHEDLDLADFWVPDRGKKGRTVRAHFEVPEGRFFVSDILLDDKPITTGAQLAQRVDVFLNVLENGAGLAAVVKPCGA